MKKLTFVFIILIALLAVGAVTHYFVKGDMKIDGELTVNGCVAQVCPCGKMVSLNESGDTTLITTAGNWYKFDDIDHYVVTDVIADSTNNALQIIKSGKYVVTLTVSLSVDAADHKIHVGLGKNGTVGTYNKAEHEVKFANRASTVSIATIASNLMEGDDLTIELTSDTNGDIVSIYHATLMCHYLSEY